MNNSGIKTTSQQNNSEIDLRDYISALWQGKWIISVITSVFFIATLIYSISLPNIYQSRAILIPVGETSNANGAMKSVSGLANLAGFSLPSSQPSDSKSAKAMKKINSLSFFTESIYPNIFLPDLMAVHSWDSIGNNVEYDNNIFDNATQNWVRNFKYPETQIPSANESFNVFIEDIFRVSQDEEGFVTIAIKHQSPYVAQKWIELIVDEINYFYRVKDKAEAEAAAEYLNKQMAQTSFTEIKEVIAQLLQQKTQQLALIEVSDFYVFEYIDPPTLILESNEPARALFCILGIIFGGIIGVIAVLIRYFISQNE